MRVIFDGYTRIDLRLSSVSSSSGVTTTIALLVIVPSPWATDAVSVALPSVRGCRYAFPSGVVVRDATEVGFMDHVTALSISFPLVSRIRADTYSPTFSFASERLMRFSDSTTLAALISSGEAAGDTSTRHFAYTPLAAATLM